MGASKKWLKAIAQIKLSASSKTANSESKFQKQSIRWNPLKSCRVIDQESTHGGEDDDDADNGVNAAQVFANQTEREEWAAIRIQTAFRCFLARRALCALRGLVRLQAAINGHNAHQNSMRTLRSIQTFVRTQAQIRAYRTLKAKGGQVVPKRIFNHAADSRPPESEDGWCDTIGSVEEIQARVQQKQEASIKRERALAYAFSNQWRANSRLNLEALFDYELDNSTWSWIWLDRWINSQMALGKVSNTKVAANGQGGASPAEKSIKFQRSASADTWSVNATATSPTKDDKQPLRRHSLGAASGLHTEQSSAGSKQNDGRKQTQKYNSVRASNQHNLRSQSKINEALVEDSKEDVVNEVEQKTPISRAIHEDQVMDGTVDEVN